MPASFARTFPPPEPDLQDNLLTVLVGLVVTTALAVFYRINGSAMPASHAQVFVITIGLVAIGVALFVRNIIPRLNPCFFSESRWTVGHEIIFELFYLQAIAIALLMVTLGFGYVEPSIVQYLVFAGVTFLLGALPVALKVQLTANHLLQKNLRQLQCLLLPAQLGDDTDQHITLNTMTKDQFSLMQNQFLFISARQNYCEITFCDGENIRQRLIRQNIGALEQQLEDTTIIRCHRSFLVNKTQVETIEGNAQGYLLHLKDCPQPVPLSRGYAKQALPQFNGVHSN